MEKIAEWGLQKSYNLFKSKVTSDIISFVAKQFAYPAQYNIQKDFPFLYSDTAHKTEHYILTTNINDKKIIGHIGVNYRESTHNPAKKIALVGGVGIDEDFRGKGLFSPFFSTILKIIRAQNIDVIGLWSDKAAIYQRFSFEEAGITYCYKGQAEDQEYLLKTYQKVTPQCSTKIHRLLELYQKNDGHITTIKRTLRDFQIIIESSMDVYLGENHYFIVNKGADLSNIVHECAPLERQGELLKIFPTSWTLWTPQRIESELSDTLVYSGLFLNLTGDCSELFQADKPFFIWGADCV